MDGKYQKYWVKARIPEKYQFRTKTQMVLDMIKDVYESGLPFGQATGDSVYGAASRIQKYLDWKDEKIYICSIKIGVCVDWVQTIHGKKDKATA